MNILKKSLPALPYSPARHTWTAVGYTKEKKKKEVINGKPWPVTRRILRWKQRRLVEGSPRIGDDDAFIDWAHEAVREIEAEGLSSIQGIAIFRNSELELIHGTF